MKRLVYSPKVKAYVNIGRRADNFPKNQVADGIIDISDYIISGNVTRNIDAVSSAEISIRNPNRQFTRPGHPIFLPMDLITIYMSRFEDYPIKTFTGYLDQTPYLQLFPGPCTLTASCTLKRLLHTYWDPGLSFSINWLKQYGWVADFETGEVTKKDPKLNRQNGINQLRPLSDAGLGELIKATLVEIGNWNERQILVEALPADLINTIFKLSTVIGDRDPAGNEGDHKNSGGATDDDLALQNFKRFMETLIGPGSSAPSSGSTGSAPPEQGKYGFDALRELARWSGIKSEGDLDIAAAVSLAESGGDPKALNTENSDGTWDAGLWQINSIHGHPQDWLMIAKNNAKAMFDISKGGTNWVPWVQYNNGAYLEYMP